MFRFINALGENGFYAIRNANVKVEILVVGDLKFLPLVIGAPHHASNLFAQFVRVPEANIVKIQHSLHHFALRRMHC